MKTCTNLCVLIIALTRAACGQGTILWNEATDGPFSQDFNNPTSLSPMQAGTNSVIGATEVERTGNNWAGHPDNFTITVPNGFLISAIYAALDKPSVWSWVGDSAYLNEFGFAPNSSNGNLLTQWNLAFLSSGVYGVYMDNHDHQLALSVASYRLDFFVQPIPEPSTVSLLLTCIALTGFVLQKRFVRTD